MRKKSEIRSKDSIDRGVLKILSRHTNMPEAVNCIYIYFIYTSYFYNSSCGNSDYNC